MLRIERRLRQMGSAYGFIHLFLLTDDAPGNPGYQNSLDQAWKYVLGLMFLSRLDSWRGLTFTADDAAFLD